jgi:hypothetical protein
MRDILGSRCPLLLVYNIVVMEFACHDGESKAGVIGTPKRVKKRLAG